jgi:hypothetical protein
MATAIATVPAPADVAAEAADSGPDIDNMMTTVQAWEIVNRILSECGPIDNVASIRFDEADELIRAFRTLGMAAPRSREIRGSGYDLSLRLTVNGRSGKSNGWSVSGSCPQWGVADIHRLHRLAVKCPTRTRSIVQMIWSIVQRYGCTMVDDAAELALVALE